jgi:hypothetical protein
MMLRSGVGAGQLVQADKAKKKQSVGRRKLREKS